MLRWAGSLDTGSVSALWRAMLRRAGRSSHGRAGTDAKVGRSHAKVGRVVRAACYGRHGRLIPVAGGLFGEPWGLIPLIRGHIKGIK